MRSGIGPHAHLVAEGVATRHDLPGVGQGLQDAALVFVEVHVVGQFIHRSKAPPAGVALRPVAAFPVVDRAVELGVVPPTRQDQCVRPALALVAAEEGLKLAAPVPSELSCAQPSQEQSNVLQQLNELLDSAVEDALNAGCLRVQTALKIQFGDAAGVFFTGHHRQVVHNAFRDYLLIEVNEIDAQVVSLMAQTSPQG